VGCAISGVAGSLTEATAAPQSLMSSRACCKAHVMSKSSVDRILKVDLRHSSLILPRQGAQYIRGSRVSA
jgi:hypothetical protein